MHVRVFEAEDMNAGLRLVRKELGPDAMILSTKTVKNSKLGLLGKPTIEITAAIDDVWEQRSAQTQAPASRGVCEKTGPQRPVRINSTVGDDIELDYQVQPQPKTDVSRYGQGDPSLRMEVQELREMVRQLAGKIDTSTVDNARHDHQLSEFLKHHGIEGEGAQRLIEQLQHQPSSQNQTLHQAALTVIEQLVSVAPPDFSGNLRQQRIALIGPTGVGKTTTLAKLAALFLGTRGGSIAFITIDTYRIAAVEQLKVYGEIMRLPVEVVISPDQLRDALDRHRDKELILIDTAGRSPKDTISIMELSQFLKPDLNIEKHLVLSAATRENELFDIIGRFAPVGIDRTIFTKIDECLTNGAIFSVQTGNGAPLSLITNGQRVPEDILLPSPRSVAEIILPPDEGMIDDQSTADKQ